MTCYITPEDLARTKIRPTPTAAEIFEPLHSVDPYDPTNSRRQSISDYWTDITTSPIKADISFFLNGDKGEGKSYTNMSLGYYCARRLAEKLGGQWNDYFNIDLIAIMEPESVYDLMQLDARYCVKDFDDVSVAYNARTSMTKKNRDNNDILITNRTENNIQLWSSPDQKFTDLVLRDTCNYYGEAEKVLPALQAGFNVLRFFRKTKNKRTGKQYYTSMWYDDHKLVKALIKGDVPEVKKLQEEYDIKRVAAAKKIKADRADAAKEESEDAPATEDPRTTAAKKYAAQKQDEVDGYVLKGMTLEEAVKEAKIAQDRYNKWVGAGWISGRKCGKRYAREG